MCGRKQLESYISPTVRHTHTHTIVSLWCNGCGSPCLCFLGWGPWIIDPVSPWALLMDHFLIFPLVWVPLDQNWGWVLLGSLRSGWCVWSWLQMAAAQQNIPSHFPLCHGRSHLMPHKSCCVLAASVRVCMSCLLCLFVWVTCVLSRVEFHIYLYGFIARFKNPACREHMKEDKEGLHFCLRTGLRSHIMHCIIYFFRGLSFFVVLSLFS